MNQKFANLFLLITLLSSSLLFNCNSKKTDNSTVGQSKIIIENSPSNNRLDTTILENSDSNDLSPTTKKILKDSIRLSGIDNQIQNKDNNSKVIGTIVLKPNSEISKKNKLVQKNVKSKKQAKIEFDELVWDFGEIIEGDIVEKKFKFTNTGNAPLEIIATSASCGCTRPSFPFLDIAPGDSNVIGVSYNSVGKDGIQNPEVTIESNTIARITILKIHGIVKPKLKKDNKPNLVKDSTKIKQ
jgi:hypothetical protein